MKDLTQKSEVIRSIEQFQLSEHLIEALDRTQDAQKVIEVVDFLKSFHEQWY